MLVISPNLIYITIILAHCISKRFSVASSITIIIKYVYSSNGIITQKLNCTGTFDWNWFNAKVLAHMQVQFKLQCENVHINHVGKFCTFLVQLLFKLCVDKPCNVQYIFGIIALTIYTTKSIDKQEENQNKIAFQ